MRGRTRLQKLVFLTQQEGLKPETHSPFSFVPYYYGPFSRDLDRYVRAAQNLGFVTEDPYEVDTPSGKTTGYRFRLTPKGEAEVQEFLEDAVRVVLEAVGKVASHYGSLELKQLLEYVYRTYPSMAKTSSE